MNQPPKPDTPPQWRRPAGVAPGTWSYINERTIADHYDAFVADTPLCRLDSRLLHDLFPAVGADKPDLVLDLGCGIGRTAVPLAALGYDVIGVDLSPSMLRILADQGANLPPGHGVISAVQANLVELGCFADQIADHAVCMFSTLGMIQGRSNRRQMLSHVSRIVRPGGRLLIHVHNRWAALKEPGGWRALSASWLRSHSDGEHEFGDATYSYRGIDEMFMHRYSRRELVADLKATRWLVDRIELVSIDGSEMLTGRLFDSLRAGGFLAVAKRAA